MQSELCWFVCVHICSKNGIDTCGGSVPPMVSGCRSNYGEGVRGVISGSAKCIRMFDRT